MSALPLLAGFLEPGCPLRTLTGIPCPTCGTTRGALAFLAGDPLAGFLYNPGVISLAAGLAIFLPYALWHECRTGRYPFRAPRDDKTRRRLALLSAIALLLNWTYVILHERLLAGVPLLG